MNIYNYINDIKSSGWRENSESACYVSIGSLQNSVLKKYPKKQTRSLIPITADLRKWR